VKKITIFFIFLSVAGYGQQGSRDTIYRTFLNPPDAAKPRVWWHWMNGNISKDGIRKDLEWMHRVGIGGFHNFEVELGRNGNTQIVDRRVVYMSPEWIDAFRFATRLADSLRLEMAVAASPGFSESGGPWVTPEEGMKKIVWNGMRVKGGTSNVKLAPARGVTGPFQNIPMQPYGERKIDITKGLLFYKDIAVVAFKLPPADRSLSDLGAVVSSSSNNFTLAQLTDGDLQTGVLLPNTAEGYGWIQFAFPQPQTIKAITMVGGGNPGMYGKGADPVDSRTLEASDDGVNFRFITHIPPGATLEQTINIPATTAKYFRVTIKNPPSTGVAEVVLHTAERIGMFEEKAAFAPAGNLLDKKTTARGNDFVEDVIDVSDKLRADGTLDWTVPQGGEWKIIRFGYSLLGTINHPAPYEATGLEVDKLDPAAVKNYFTHYLDLYKNATGGLMGNKAAGGPMRGKGGLQYLVTDSWEAGAQNWTANLPAEFQRRRGYSIIPWLPVLTGAIVKDAGASESFLFDFRKTLSEMVAAYYYDALTEILAGYGMKRYSESHEDGRAFIGDGMDAKRKAAIPMSAMWTPNPYVNQNDQTRYTMDIRESASVAHIYGQNLVAAESLTALGVEGFAWSYYPGNLKASADLELASGLNRFVIHCSPHQPRDDKFPGLGLGPFGQWYTRHETWAEQATAWNAYLSRSSYLLQQGRFVADVVYYYGEDDNITDKFGKRPPVIPEGYSYDFINSDALVSLLSVKDGRLVTPSGMSYRVLVLDSNAVMMSLPVLRKLKELAAGGAVIAGPMGSGKTLSEMKVLPDFSYGVSRTKFLYVHRQLADRDIYWVNSRSDTAQDIMATFRITGKVPVLWHPETGLAEPLSYSIGNGVTNVQMHFSPNDAVFVVFKEKAVKTSIILPAVKETPLETVAGGWNVHFQKGRGAPEKTIFNELVSYTENTDKGIKYFSGTATYTKTITADKSWFAGKPAIWLDLGEVKNLAEVIVNNRSLGIVWKQPFRVDVSGVLKAGANNVEIRVTNLWVNRLIGDQQPDVASRITYTTMPFYQANSPLQASGLLGPVRIITASSLALNKMGL